MITEELYQFFLKSNFQVSTDTRTMPEGALHFCLKGNNFDGNKYALDALSLGASYCVTDDSYLAKTNDRLILVPDVLNALQLLANYHRKKCKAKIIALTGSNGKTTTKELLKAIIESKYTTIATKGNLNNHIGVPLTLLSLRPEHEYGIVEMGANHINEIEKLCKIAEPDTGLITNIGEAHLEGFGGIAGVLKAKTELFSYLHNNKRDIFFNIANTHLADIADKFTHKANYYGTKSTNYFAETITESPYLSLKITLKQETINVNSQLTGAYNLENILAACCVGHFFDVPIIDIKNALENYQPTNQRSQIVSTKNNQVIVDCYNANPTSMNAAIANLDKAPANSKVLILGEMKELGEFSDELHYQILKKTRTLSDIKYKVFIGEPFLQFQNTYELSNEYFFSTTSEAKLFLTNMHLKGNLILLKGSRSNQMEQLLECF